MNDASDLIELTFDNEMGTSLKSFESCHGAPR
jgi:hypothetical protein